MTAMSRWGWTLRVPTREVWSILLTGPRRAPEAKRTESERRSVVEDDVEQRAVDLQPTVVLDKAQLPKLVHEEADARAGCADHLRQRFLADLGHAASRPPFLAEVGQQQKDPREPLLAGVEELIHEVFLDPDAPRQQMRDEQLRELGVLVERPDHGKSRYQHDRTVRHCGCRRHTDRLAGEA